MEAGCWVRRQSTNYARQEGYQAGLKRGAEICVEMSLGARRATAKSIEQAILKELERVKEPPNPQ